VSISHILLFWRNVDLGNAVDQILDCHHHVAVRILLVNITEPLRYPARDVGQELSFGVGINVCQCILGISARRRSRKARMMTMLASSAPVSPVSLSSWSLPA